MQLSFAYAGVGYSIRCRTKTSLMSGMTFRMDISLRFCLCKSRFEHEIYFLLHAEQAP